MKRCVMSLALLPGLLLVSIPPQPAGARVTPYDGDSAYVVALEATPPREVFEPRIKIPGEAMNRGVEGWVLLNYTVLPDGTTSDVEIVERSIPGVFDESAVNAVRDARYEPATRDGVPVEADMQMQIVYFYKTGTNRVSSGFLRRIQAGSRALAKGDIEGARERIDKLAATPRLSLAEDAYYHLLLASYHEKLGAWEQAADMIDRALVVAHKAVDRGSRELMLRQAVEYRARAGRSGGSIEAWAELTDLTGPLPADDPLRPLVEDIQARIEQPEPIVSEVVLEPCGTCEGENRYALHHPLLRNRFTLDRIEGDLESASLACGDHLAHIEPVMGETYELPSTAERCALRLEAPAPIRLEIAE